MLVYLPLWLEPSYLEIFPRKRVCYGIYEQTLEEEDNEIILIKNMLTNFEDYRYNPHIIVIFNSIKKDIEEITTAYILKQLCERFSYTYDKQILIYCNKYEFSPFIAVLTLSLGGMLPLGEEKELIPMNSTISTSKYLQSSLWFYFLNQKSNYLFKNYSHEKCLYLFNNIIELEGEFGFIDEELAHIFFLPILHFH